VRNPLRVIGTFVVVGLAATACGSASPWPASTIPTATPLPDGYVMTIPSTPNTSPQPTRSASGPSESSPPGT
jgi:hypothetical protein